jgi:formylglycine-generating enzyme required for sulfatase activity
VHLSRLFSLACLALVACAAGTKAPTAPLSPIMAPSPDEDSEEGDDDGDVEATDAPVAAPDGPCGRGMVLVAAGELRFCIDVYEASLVESVDGEEKPFPHWLPVDGHAVRAVSVAGAFPQAFISEVQAEDACGASGKRLCTNAEWKTACVGPAKTTFPYGEARKPGACHDQGKSAVGAVFGAAALAEPIASVAPPTTKALRPGKSSARTAKDKTAKSRPAHVTQGRAAQTTHARASESRGEKHGERQHEKRSAKRTAAAKTSTRPASVTPSVWTQLNDPRLGQVEGALARTGSHEACVNGFGVFDMVGNVHEWVKTDPSLPHGTFAGGYYLDTALNGDGCNYRTTAHAHDYHDYSTGFRCCADAR